MSPSPAQVSFLFSGHRVNRRQAASSPSYRQSFGKNKRGARRGSVPAPACTGSGPHTPPSRCRGSRCCGTCRHNILCNRPARAHREHRHSEHGQFSEHIVYLEIAGMDMFLDRGPGEILLWRFTKVRERPLVWSASVAHARFATMPAKSRYCSLHRLKQGVHELF